MLNQQIINHAKSCGNKESCGFVLKKNNNFEYFPCRNIALNPYDSFEISTEDWLRAEEIGEVVALVHSHPDDFPILSKTDQLIQQKTALDWWLVHSNSVYQFRLMLPLLGRDFKHGTTDCYTLFRDAYHLSGINLPDFYRKYNWWSEGKNYYLENMPENGFYKVSANEITEGDVIIICLGSSVPNHAAIYVGEQMILHHCPNRKSKRDIYNGFWLKYTHSIWRHKEWQSYGFMGISNNLAINLK
ncbi:C40 family peptidase [Zophobihabitans entericus]|uniref:Phage tail protein n=1 Tax=Zophobihabitans entericus TaxID=1635327 RepID=A0A6G9I9W7_9GAMM|nr:C40 family peptidase [Zophobihabitans entericus]QIQ21025.1 phage tail protein [Zophobihabitans entericus]